VKTIAFFLLFVTGAVGFMTGGHVWAAEKGPSVPQAEAPLWRKALRGAVICEPEAQAGSVLMALDGGNLSVYSTDGSLLWDYYAGGKLSPFVTRSGEGTSYICRLDGVCIALSRTGRELWRVKLDGPVASPVLTGWDGRLFLATNTRAYCYTASGFRLWAVPLDSGPAIPLTGTADGGFFLVTQGLRFMRFGPYGKRSETRLSEIPAAAEETDGKDHDFLLFYRSGGVETLQSKTGKRGTMRGSPMPVSPVAAAGNAKGAALLLKDGRVAFLSTGDLKITWNARTFLSAQEAAGLARGDARLTLDKDGVLLLTKQGAAAWTRDGTQRWMLPLRNAAALPCISDDGRLYMGGLDWILYAFRAFDPGSGEVPSSELGSSELGSGEAAQPETYGEIAPDSENLIKKYSLDRGDGIRTFLKMADAAIQAGDVGGKEKGYVLLLTEIALGGRRMPVNERITALQDLGHLGSKGMIPFLVDMFNNEREPSVRAAAALAIGSIGIDYPIRKGPDAGKGTAICTFRDAIFSTAPIRDERLLYSIVQATAALCRFGGPPAAATGVRVLTMLSTPDKPGAVRAAAQRELKKLQ
jgi:outer membrane protein assembly factor BamB